MNVAFKIQEQSYRGVSDDLHGAISVDLLKTGHGFIPAVTGATWLSGGEFVSRILSTRPSDTVST